MGSRPRTAFNDEHLLTYRTNLLSIIEAIDQVLEGKETLGKACCNNGLSYSSFRSLIPNVSSINNKKDNAILSELYYDLGSYQKYFSRSERVYTTVFSDTLNVKTITLEYLYSKMPEDAEATIDYVIDQLFSEREKKIFNLYFDEGLSYEEIGKEFGLTRDRIHQIFIRSLHKLCSPSAKKVLSNGVSKSKFITPSRSITVDECLELITERDRLIKEYSKDHQIKEWSDSYSDLLIENLDLSVRAYNCLKRANVRTVKDILERPESALICIRNLGKKSYIEIINKLRELGYQFSVEKYPIYYGVQTPYTGDDNP